MARGVNKAIIVGTLGQDPDVKYTASGSPVVNISVATNESWKDKTTGENVEKTEWHRIVIFGKLGEIAAQYLKKGSQVYFEGKIQTRKSQDQTSNNRHSTEIVSNEMQMIGAKPGVGRAGAINSPAQQQQQRQAPVQQNAPAPAAAATIDDGFDDITF